MTSTSARTPPPPLSSSRPRSSTSRTPSRRWHRANTSRSSVRPSLRGSGPRCGKSCFRRPGRACGWSWRTGTWTSRSSNRCRRSCSPSGRRTRTFGCSSRPRCTLSSRPLSSTSRSCRTQRSRQGSARASTPQSSGSTPRSWTQSRNRSGRRCSTQRFTLTLCSANVPSTGRAGGANRTTSTGGTSSTQSRSSGIPSRAPRVAPRQAASRSRGEWCRGSFRT
mmetsp:Transcript_63972/g.152562  ORF Transcript_63972/g.152562 Transcript_63972/m.152562 type:complete len:222 (+) Transcript_63972:758-1423(+)